MRLLKVYNRNWREPFAYKTHEMKEDLQKFEAFWTAILKLEQKIYDEAATKNIGDWKLRTKFKVIRKRGVLLLSEILSFSTFALLTYFSSSSNRFYIAQCHDLVAIMLFINSAVFRRGALTPTKQGKPLPYSGMKSSQQASIASKWWSKAWLYILLQNKSSWVQMYHAIQDIVLESTESPSSQMWFRNRLFGNLGYINQSKLVFRIQNPQSSSIPRLHSRLSEMWRWKLRLDGLCSPKQLREIPTAFSG